MILTQCETKILLKMFDICYLTLQEPINIRLLKGVVSHDYLYISIRELESKGIINSNIEDKCKYIQLTNKGAKIVKALDTVRKL